MRYRRASFPGATYFFTVNLADRRADYLTQQIDLLRDSIRRIKIAHPFHIDAMVILPDHIHAMWTLPENDSDYSRRWSLIKAGFSRGLEKTERINKSRLSKRERVISRKGDKCQRRFWEHLSRDDRDYAAHVDYIHINPVKHGYVARAADWPHSSIHRFIERGIVAPDWAVDADIMGDFGEIESR